ncbi:hypothetical protein YC2023_023118 [Brassica napus]
MDIAYQLGRAYKDVFWFFLERDFVKERLLKGELILETHMFSSTYRYKFFGDKIGSNRGCETQDLTDKSKITFSSIVNGDNLLPLNEEGIFENVSLVVVKMKSGTMKVVNIKIAETHFRKVTLFIHCMVDIDLPRSQYLPKALEQISADNERGVELKLGVSRARRLNQFTCVICCGP